MPKKTIVLFPKTVSMLKEVGENIRLARLRRHISAVLLAERAGISRVTLHAIERGEPSVAFGNYVQVLTSLNLAEDVLKIAGDDVLGRKLQDMELMSKRGIK